MTTYVPDIQVVRNAWIEWLMADPAGVEHYGSVEAAEEEAGQAFDNFVSAVRNTAWIVGHLAPTGSENPYGG